MTSYGLVADIREALEAPPDAILMRTLNHSGGVELTLYAFDAGQSLSRFTATLQGIVEILDGVAEVDLDDDTHVVGTGAWIAVPPGTSVAIRATTQMTIAIAVVSEARAGG